MFDHDEDRRRNAGPSAFNPFALPKAAGAGPAPKGPIETSLMFDGPAFEAAIRTLLAPLGPRDARRAVNLLLFGSEDPETPVSLSAAPRAFATDGGYMPLEPFVTPRTEYSNWISEPNLVYIPGVTGIAR